VKEVTYAVGAEYLSRFICHADGDIFMKVLKGARQFFSLGAGFNTLLSGRCLLFIFGIQG
jgi:hypothetical protein